jgi:hypothetical protein
MVYQEREKCGLWYPKVAESEGPFSTKTTFKTIFLLALVMIDPATEWFEIFKVTNILDVWIQNLFNCTWLKIDNPRSQFIDFYNGNRKIQTSISKMYKNYGIIPNQLLMKSLS